MLSCHTLGDVYIDTIVHARFVAYKTSSKAQVCLTCVVPLTQVNCYILILHNDMKGWSRANYRCDQNGLFITIDKELFIDNF